MLLPNAERAIIAPEKLRDYLPNEDHVDNRGKARVFAALGYYAENWQDLGQAFREQHLRRDATEGERDLWGVRYEITALLIGASGSATIRSVWQIDHGTEVPRFVTAYPG